ncbi:MAG TPA: hypothetical protein VEH82_06785, partial [Acidimicrobiales bacterium]|nr:hypothetical protein [Acidimicrobiales bacterium]
MDRFLVLKGALPPAPTGGVMARSSRRPSRKPATNVFSSRRLLAALGGGRRHLLVVGTLVLALVSTSFVFGLEGAAAPLSVSVVGNHLVDGSGNPLVLRGADLSGTEFSCIQNGTPTSRGWSIYGGQPLDQPSTYAAM